MNKVCTKCRQPRPLTDFYENSRSRDGLSWRCRHCQISASARWAKENPERNARNVLRRQLRWHGLTPEQFDELVEAQGGVCAICKQSCSLNSRLSIDHDHTCCPQTGGIGPALCGACRRGLLCHQCNTGIGKFRDDLDILRSAIQYLESYAAVAA